MTLVNHLKDIDAQTLYHAVAYGKHLVQGNLAKSVVTGTSPNHTIVLQQMLGLGEWDACEGLWWNGTEVKPAKYKFHPGKQTPNPVLKTFTADHTTDTFTSTAHAFANNDQVIHMPGDLPPEITAGSIYYIISATANTYQLSLTQGGSAHAISANGSGTLQVYKNDATQGVDEKFQTDTPHSGFAWLRAELDTGLGDANTKDNPPTGLKGIFRTSKVEDYNSSGTPQGAAYSTNPARQIADLILRVGGRPTSRINWTKWVTWRDFLGANITHDYTALPIDGFGLTASLYNGTNFDTLVATRVDPVLDFVSSAGSPGVGVDVDNFSVRWEGKIKAKFSETFTFYLAHTHGAKLYVNNLSTPIIDQWGTSGSHSATFVFVAGTYYDIKLEWKHTTGNADLRLEWQSISQVREVVSHRALYPKTVTRPRYETHPFFAAPTRLDDAVRTILNLCNSTVQEVNGKLEFFCLEQLTTSSYSFTNDRIVDGSVELTPRDVTSLRNTWQARFRDVDSQYLEFPIDPLLIERTDLIDAASRKIDGQSIELFNCSVHQAYRTMDNVVKRSVDSKYQVELTGMPETFPVLAGDRVALNIEFLDWTAKPMLVLESNDASSEQTADERTFVMQEWPGFTVYT